MGLFSLEHGRAAYKADFVVYGMAIVALALSLLIAERRGHWPLLLACTAGGLLSWSGIEYLLHRFVLHGLPPFSRWHAEHHARPTALIGMPTLASAALIALLVFLPMWALASLRVAGAFTLGVMTGYLAFGLTHHATHHGPHRNAWLARRQRWHALHHRSANPEGHFGVTSEVWDHVLGSATGTSTRRARPARAANPRID